MLAQERLKELMSYDPAAGEFRWRVSRGPRRAGSVSGCMNVRGYIQIKIDGKDYLAHRLAWLYVHGEFVQELDHINGIRTDNRISNLRPATRSQNNGNARKQSNNTSGLKGVSWYKRLQKWKAQITFNGRYIWLGIFDTREAAHAAYCAKSRELFGEFARAA